MIEQFRFYLRHSYNDLRVNGQRTIFALLCIAAGVAAIVSLQTVGVMLEDTLTTNLQESNRSDIRITAGGFVDEEEDDEAEDGEADAAVEQPDEAVDENTILETSGDGTTYISPLGYSRFQQWLTDESGYGQYVETFTYQQSITGFTGLSLSIPDKSTFASFTWPMIIDATAYPLYGEVRDQTGESLAEVMQDPTDIVLSENLADTLEAGIGDEVTISGGRQPFIVRGIVDSDTEGGMDENFIATLTGFYYLDVSAVDAELIQGIDPGAQTVFIKLNDTIAMQDMAEDIEARYPFLNVRTTEDLQEQNEQISDVLNDLVIIMGLISLLIGGIGIVNTMLVMVSRRTTEIAVLKTVGLEAEQITTLFLVEAVLMGIVGSIAGILLGWVAAYLLQGFAEQFVAQPLTFRISLSPAINGLIVGIVVTTVFGFLPTLAAGQVRPSLVLRPSDNVVPRAGLLRSFVALLFVIVITSLVAQALTGDLLSSRALRTTGRMVGLFLGSLMGLGMVVGGFLAFWQRQPLAVRAGRWAVYIAGFALAGYVFGDLIPAVLILFGAFVGAAILYMILMAMIWSLGGGDWSEMWLWKLPPSKRKMPWVFVHVAVRLPVWFFNVLLYIITFPLWLIGRLMQRLRIVDLKVALRSMLSTKNRGASTLLALGVGVFTLSLITMLARTIDDAFGQLLERDTGGNVIIFATGGESSAESFDKVTAKLDELQAEDIVIDYAALAQYNAELVSVRDVSTCTTPESGEPQCA
ncbi:MAG: FtsX-like permease family protein, partial [Chloroflexi bacterium]|nr:FtsX-like permease family protein [Chloroflexota bacterium]